MDHASTRNPSSSPSSSSLCSLDGEQWELVTPYGSPSQKQNATPPATFEVAARPATPEPTMPGWKDDYLSALLDAEQSNPINFDLVEACTNLNDRIATLEAEKGLYQSERPTSPPGATLSSKTPPVASAATAKQDAAAAANTSLLHARARADLALTLTQKAHLEARLRATTLDRDRLLSISKAQQQSMAALAAERDSLARKVRDQASELRGKNELLQRVQDDVVALEIERNMAEKAKARLNKENQELVDRWMIRMAGEANAMNKRNEKGEGPAA